MGKRWMDARAFQSLVQRSMDSLPEQFGDRLWNLVVKVEREPSWRDLEALGLEQGESLFGLYTGVPLTQRGGSLSGSLPDVITIYQGPIERHCRGDEQCIRGQVESTVIHEVAHYFGISDERLIELQKY